jgi:phage terminase large subunit-like protein
VAKMDPAGNLKPDKSKSTKRIDGMVALIMAIDQAMRNPNLQPYQDGGILVL